MSSCSHSRTTRNRRGPITCSRRRSSTARISARPPSNTSGRPMRTRSTRNRRKPDTRHSSATSASRSHSTAPRSRLEPSAPRQPAALRHDLPRAPGERDTSHAHCARVLRPEGPAERHSRSQASCSQGSHRSTSGCSARPGPSPATRNSTRVATRTPRAPTCRCNRCSGRRTRRHPRSRSASPRRSTSRVR